MSSILWLNWKDSGHPGSGGAEVVLCELSKRLVADGHEVTILTASYEGAAKDETVDGVRYIRVGSNRYLHSFQALAYYFKNLRGKYDVVVEVVNTAPYFASLFRGKSNFYLFYHQLANEIWHHETKFPLNIIGYRLLEPVATRMLSKAKAKVITISESTKQDLLKHGFKAENISIISEGIEMEPLERIEQATKYSHPTVLSLGAMRAMKQTWDQVKAFEIAKEKIPDLKMKLVGNAEGPYGETVLEYIKHSQYADDIEYLGRVPYEEKVEVMQKSHLVLVTSIKEGWCLVVTEANSQGTPAVAYNADGLRDSIRHGETGYLTEVNDPTHLAERIVYVLGDAEKYHTVRVNGWRWSREITFRKSYEDFKEVVEL
ncbi:glycosyltransferase family 4 protein [Candidatus Saccharibacteria bacterium]|nr:glycosyltransferase family 4 protein [Candidatus Saccharibacteria bacterium]